MYELTHHEDDYDLRYRLKEKIYLPSEEVPAPVPISIVPSILSNAGTGGVGGAYGEAKEERKGGDLSSSSEAAAAAAVPVAVPPKREKSFLLVTWSHVILCEGRLLQLYDFAGVKVK